MYEKLCKYGHGLGQMQMERMWKQMENAAKPTHNARQRLRNILEIEKEHLGKVCGKTHKNI